MEQYSGDKLDFDRVIEPDDIASLYHTGGTTGTPKLAKRTHLNEVVMALDLQIMGDLNPESVLMCGLPLFHVNGTIGTGLSPFAAGGHVVLLSPMGYRDPGVIRNFFKIVEHYKAQGFSAVPKVVHVIDAVPLTPVGKIFKPALRRQVIEWVFARDLEVLGETTATLDVKAVEDKVHGTSVAIQATCGRGVTPESLEKQIREILARYTIHYSLTVA